MNFNNLVTSEICQYLDYDSIISLGASCKDMNYRIKNTLKYKTLKKLIDKGHHHNLIKNVDIMIEGQNHEFNTLIAILIIMFPIIHQIMFLSLFGIFNGIVIIGNVWLLFGYSVKKMIRYGCEKYSKIKSMYLWSLTNYKYNEITQYLLYKYRDSLDLDGKDLLICVLYNNMDTFRFLLKEKNNSVIYDDLMDLYSWARDNKRKDVVDSIVGINF